MLRSGYERCGNFCAEAAVCSNKR